jgi:itaconate CoA-transferase
MLPLQGTTVVAVEQAVAAPFATRQLADMGARVIKIERPSVGDFARGYDTTVRGMASHFVWLNRSKESLTLDLKRPDAQGVLRALLATADVFVHNLAPGAVDRLGFGADVLRASFPRLITCEISGYGSNGPYAQKKAYDLLIQSETGLLSITGTNDTPSKVGISIADIAAGMYAYTSVLTALLMREKTGVGVAMEVSLLDALGEWMGYPMYYAAYGPEAPRRTGAHHASIAPYGPVTTGDGQVVYLGIQNEREWKRFCEIVLEDAALAGDARFASNAKRVAHREVLDGLIASRVATLTGEALIDRLERAQIANARMNTLQEFLAHPQLSDRGRWRDVDSPVGTLRALVPPVTCESIEPVMGPVPDVGQHTDQILAELGVDASTIAAWRSDGVV